MARHLAWFGGILQVDVYSAYSSFAKARAATGRNKAIRLSQAARLIFGESFTTCCVSACKIRCCDNNRAGRIVQCLNVEFGGEQIGRSKSGPYGADSPEKTTQLES